MKEVLKMRLPKTKVYFFLVAFSMGTVIFYISYQNASISANNSSIRVTHLRNQKPGFTNQMLASMRQREDRIFNDQQPINMSHTVDAVALDKAIIDSPSNSKIKIIKTADSFDRGGHNEMSAHIQMSNYDKRLNDTEKVNSELQKDPMSQTFEDKNIISSVEKLEQILTKDIEILPPDTVEKGFSDLTMTEKSTSGVTDIENGFIISRLSTAPTDATYDQNEVRSDMTNEHVNNSRFTRVSKFSNSIRNNSTAANITMPKYSNSVDLMSSSKSNNKNTKLNLPFQLPLSKDINVRTNRILEKYKLSEKNRYLPETNSTKYPLDKSKRFIYLNSFVQRDILEKYRNLIKNTSFDAIRHVHNSNKNYNTLQMVSTMRPEACNDCFNHHYMYYFSPKAVCTGPRNVEILLLISSTPRNFEARNVIRATWGSLCHNTNLGCVFLLGMNDGSNTEIMNAISDEHEQYLDLLMGNFTDSYANLTYKTMMGLKWAVDNCALVQFIMKTDDDMYVNTELLPVLLKDAKPSKFMGGFCWAESSPHRNMNSKWYVSYQMYSNSKFPPMCSGTGYVMSKDTAEKVVQVSKNIPFFYLEDVYVALCLKQLRIPPKRLRGFNNVFINFDPCAYRHYVITSHEINPDNLNVIWKSSRNCPMSSPHITYEELPYS